MLVHLGVQACYLGAVGADTLGQRIYRSIQSLLRIHQMGANRLKRLLCGAFAVLEGVGRFLLGVDCALYGRSTRLEFIGRCIDFVCGRLQPTHNSL